MEKTNISFHYFGRISKIFFSIITRKTNIPLLPKGNPFKPIDQAVSTSKKLGGDSEPGISWEAFSIKVSRFATEIAEQNTKFFRSRRKKLCVYNITLWL